MPECHGSLTAVCLACLVSAKCLPFVWLPASFCFFLLLCASDFFEKEGWLKEEEGRRQGKWGVCRKLELEQGSLDSYQQSLFYVLVRTEVMCLELWYCF